jgi:hypothetical protein
VIRSVLSGNVAPYHAPIVRRRAAAKNDNDVLPALPRDAIGKRGAWPAREQLSLASSTSWQTLAISSRAERRLDTFDDGIKPALVGGGINQREAVDQAAIATEHYLLVEGLAPTISGQDKPIASKRAVVDGKIRVRVALHIVLVACNHWVGRQPAISPDHPHWRIRCRLLLRTFFPAQKRRWDIAG